MHVTPIQQQVLSALQANAADQSNLQSAGIGLLLNGLKGETNMRNRFLLSEITINFAPMTKISHAPGQSRLLIDVMRESEHYKNSWEIPGANNWFPEYRARRDLIERRAFGYPPFKDGVPQVDGIDRPRYAALNLFKNVNGGTDIDYGQASLVLSTPAVQEYATLACRDSFDYWRQLLIDNGRMEQYMTFPEDPTYHPVVGTTANFNHQLLKFYKDCVHQQALNPPYAKGIAWQDWLHDVGRAEKGYAVSNSKYPYWEVQIHGVIEFENDIRGLRAGFDEYFGTRVGKVLQDWAIQHNWFLTWVHDRKMVLDPNGAGNNYNTRDRGLFRKKFASLWGKSSDSINVTRQNKLWSKLWEFTPAPARYEPNPFPDQMTDDLLKATFGTLSGMKS